LSNKCQNQKLLRR